MLKPTSAFVYVFQDASTSEEGACVALPVGVGEGDCVLPANELQDASTITKIRTMDCFLTLDSLRSVPGLRRQRVALAPLARSAC